MILLKSVPWASFQHAWRARLVLALVCLRLLLVVVCLLWIHIDGNHELGPTITRKPPDVDFVSSRSPARSASTNNHNSKSSGLSQINARNLAPTVDCIYSISRRVRLSSLRDHLVTLDASRQTGRKRSGRAMRAPHKSFIRTELALPLNSPWTLSFAGMSDPSGQ